MALPAAAAQGATMSLGCIGNRVYTEVADESIYLMVRGADLARVAGALDTIAHANEQLAAFHRNRRADLTAGDAARS
jgi:hypothetical protein